MGDIASWTCVNADATVNRISASEISQVTRIASESTSHGNASKFRTAILAAAVSIVSNCPKSIVKPKTGSASRSRIKDGETTSISDDVKSFQRERMSQANTEPCESANGEDPQSRTFQPAAIDDRLDSIAVYPRETTYPQAIERPHTAALNRHDLFVGTASVPCVSTDNNDQSCQKPPVALCENPNPSRKSRQSIGNRDLSAVVTSPNSSQSATQKCSKASASQVTVGDEDYLDMDIEESGLEWSVPSSPTLSSPGNRTTLAASSDQQTALGPRRSTITFGLPTLPRMDHNKPKPFLRQKHPAAVENLRNSPIPQVLSSLRIPTCFRIAEALRELNNRSSFAVELYATATNISMSKDNEVQDFRFTDMFFPNHPPYLTGTLVKRSRYSEITEACNDSQMIHRAIIRAYTPSRSSASVKPGLQSAASSSPPSVPSTFSQQLGDMSHVCVESIKLSSWQEVEYVRRIVDPEDVVLRKGNSRV